MTPAPAQSAGDHAWHPTGGRGFGLVILAAIVLAWVGTFNLGYGVATIAHKGAFFPTAHYVFGTFHSWGWITLTLGLLQLLAGVGVLLGNQLARWFGVVVVGFTALAQDLSILVHPWWSLAIIIVNLIALYGLYVHGSTENADVVLADLEALLCAQQDRR